MAKSNPQDFKICCIAFNKSGNIIQMNFQKENTTHPKQYFYAKQTKQPYKIFLHAELNVLLKSKNPYGIFVCRVDSEGNLVNSKPCDICQLALDASKVAKIFYTENCNLIKEL